MPTLNIPNSFGNDDDDAPIPRAFAIAEAAEPPKAREGGRLVVCGVDELPPGGRKLIDDGKQGIGVFNIDGRFYALKNVCPHAGAELCRGSIHNTCRPGGVGAYEEALAGRVLRCPWHGWEFDIVTGKGLYDAKSRVATYPVEVVDGQVVVKI
ncbi:MAG: Rieske (2Fe-2S) protein [Phycisphaerae bacterium]